MSDRCTATLRCQLSAADHPPYGHSVVIRHGVKTQAVYWDDGDPRPRIEITDAMKAHFLLAYGQAKQRGDDEITCALFAFIEALNGDSK